MKKIAILSSHYGVDFRGAEFWIKNLKEQLKKTFDINVFLNFAGSYRDWISADVIIPVDGCWQVFFCRLLTWINRKPMVVFGHSGLGADDKWNLLCSPNIFVAFSSFQKDWAEKYKLPWTKIVKIPHAIDLTKFMPAPEKPNRKIVLCVAANTPDKRVNLVKSAVKLIPGAEFIAVGKGNPIQTSFNEMPGIYKKADVFCFVPQPWEAFGLVFLEALASNLPVVTANDPVRREIVGDAGILVDNPENSIELSRAIILAFKKDWGGKPRDQAKKFSWEKVTEKYEKLFEEVVK
jgi:glycosyltransferase involved in cell wall biosynthesis